MESDNRKAGFSITPKYLALRRSTPKYSAVLSSTLEYFKAIHACSAPKYFALLRSTQHYSLALHSISQYSKVISGSLIVTLDSLFIRIGMLTC